MLADAIVLNYIARSCQGSYSRRNTGTHSSVPVLTRIRNVDLLLAIARCSSTCVGPFSWNLGATGDQDTHTL